MHLKNSRKPKNPKSIFGFNGFVPRFLHIYIETFLSGSIAKIPFIFFKTVTSETLAFIRTTPMVSNSLYISHFCFFSSKQTLLNSLNSMDTIQFVFFIFL